MTHEARGRFFLLDPFAHPPSLFSLCATTTIISCTRTMATAIVAAAAAALAEPSPWSNFVPGTPFVRTGTDLENLEFHPDIKSDHAEVGARVGNLRVNAFNPSNPKYHGYFNAKDRPALAETHLFKCLVDDPAWLQAKYHAQADTVIERMRINNHQVYILTEMTVALMVYVRDTLGRTDYIMVPDPDEVDAKTATSGSNVTCIVIHKSIVQDYKSVEIKYLDEEKSPCTMRMPCVFARVVYDHLPEQPMTVAIWGVHVRGNRAQRPGAALKALDEFLGGSTSDAMHVLAGDWNTIPSVVAAFAPRLKVLAPQYPTHVNPHNGIAAYDLVAYLQPAGETDERCAPTSSPLSDMPEESLLLVQCLATSAVHQSRLNADVARNTMEMLHGMSKIKYST